MTTTPWPKAICFSLILPLIIVQSSNQSLYSTFALLHNSQRKHETSNEHGACEANTTCMFIPLSLNSY